MILCQSRLCILRNSNFPSIGECSVWRQRVLEVVLAGRYAMSNLLLRELSLAGHRCPIITPDHQDYDRYRKV